MKSPARLRVRKHCKVLADLQLALRRQLLGRGAHHDTVVVLYRQAQQGIAHRATDHVDFHARSVVKRFQRFRR